ncbi:MAG TPA: anaerobic ribonucleoside-triphosphate reductase activating protein [Syntrophales bacterium]|nr:anaerobic ribonucleoside-triphosphate reductase activating protein [Syntrophales bacterium]
MKIGGLQKVSLIEYPGKICAIIFSQGCNFRCPYCYNPELVDPELYKECLTQDEILSFLAKRKGKLDAVTISGGEPTLQPDLLEFIKRVRKIGYLIKIDTNGSRPEIVEKLIGGKLIDYIAMDVKGPLKKYRMITRSQIHEEEIKQSIEMIMKSGMPYEFRTTVLKNLLEESDILEIGKLIKNARLYLLQYFIPTRTLDKEFLNYEAYSQEEMERFKGKLIKDIPVVLIR